MDYKEDYKEELDRELRTVRTRDYVFSKSQMRSFRIKGIFNSIGEIDKMGEAFIESFAKSLYREEIGEIAVVETAIKGFPAPGGSYGEKRELNPLKVVSVIIFTDVWSWHMYGLKNLDIYGNESLLSLLN